MTARRVSLPRALADDETARYLGCGWSRGVTLRVLALNGAVAISAHGGYMVFIPYGGGAWEGHYAMPRHIRGAQAIRCAGAAFRHLFTQHNASVIFGRTPRDHRAARVINHRLGGIPTGEGTFLDGRPYVVYRFERERWVK